MIHITSNSGRIGPFWWVNQHPDVIDLSDNPYSSFLVRLIGSCGFGSRVRFEVEPLSTTELFG